MTYQATPDGLTVYEDGEVIGWVRQADDETGTFFVIERGPTASFTGRFFYTHAEAAIALVSETETTIERADSFLRTLVEVRDLPEVTS